MSKRYGVGILLCTVIMCALYCADYQRMSSGNQLPFEENTEEFAAEPADAGREQRLYKYCLKEQDGAVYVYLGDGVTLYETTSIRTGQLPETMRQEVSDGKYLLNEEELYSFLENYGEIRQSQKMH